MQDFGNHLPHPRDFRAWLQDHLAELGVSAARISDKSGLGRNFVGQFLADQSRGITLTSAHDISCAVHEIAAERGLPVRTFGQVRNG